MKKKLILFFVGYAAWCLLNWVPDWQHLIVGVFVSLFVAYITGDFFIQRTHMLKHPLRYYYFIFNYLPIFLWEVIKANIEFPLLVRMPEFASGTTNLIYQIGIFVLVIPFAIGYVYKFAEKKVR